MAPTAAICNSFKTEVLQGRHNFTALTGTNTVTSVAAASGTLGPGGTACTVYTGTFTNAGSNAYAGLVITMSGSTTVANNGTYRCVASTTTTLTLANPNGASQSSGTEPTVSCGDAFYVALYTSTWTGDKATTAYSATNEVGNSGSYTAGGGALTSVTPVLSTDTAVCDYADVSFTSATITARGALIYNKIDAANRAVQVLDFTTDKTSTSGTFTITWPVPDASNAILRLA